MNVLVVDTSTKACVLGLAKKEDFYDSSEMVDRSHSKVVLPKIDELLEESGVDKSELDLVIFGQGPGSFTGLRIGVGVVQGLAFGLNIPVVAVSSMACLAQSVYRDHQHENCLVALNARNTEVYFGSYSINDGFAALNGTEGVFEASEIPVQNREKSWVGIGNSWQLRAEMEYPTARDLFELGLHRYHQGKAVTALEAKPEYLRERVANLPGAASEADNKA